MEAILFSPHAEETNIFQLILQQAGFMVRTYRSLDQAIQDWPEHPADLILVVLSGEHARSVMQIKQLRGHTAVPILLICDLLPEDLLVSYLESGADQVIIKPYSVRALIAQIRAVMRRGAGVPFFSLPRLNQKEIELDPANRTVRVADREPQRLTHLEFRLLFTLMTHSGQIIPTEQIVEYVWGYEGEGNRELVRGLVQRLRSKVEENPRQPKYILTELGIGYYFNS